MRVVFAFIHRFCLFVFISTYPLEDVELVYANVTHKKIELSKLLILCLFFRESFSISSLNFAANKMTPYNGE